jgi:predicted negative regulator of RcsB-dependent stress response
MPVLNVAAIAKLLTRNGSKIAVGTLVAVAVWFAFQSWRVSTANTVLEGRVATETARANTAVVDLAKARSRRMWSPKTNCAIR